MDTDLPSTALNYMQRMRDYYLALDYDNPYRWANFTDVPFRPLRKPVADSRVGLVTTAAPFKPDAGDQGPGAPYNAAAKFIGCTPEIPKTMTPLVFPTSATTAPTPPPKTSTATFHWRSAQPTKTVTSAACLRATTDCRPIAASRQR